MAVELCLSLALRARILAHAEASGARECCGALIGSCRFQREVLVVIPAHNIAARPQREFELEPAALLRAEQLARLLGLEVIGCYHSHPAGPAEPSARDLAAAVPSWSYLVVARSSSGAPDLGAIASLPAAGFRRAGARLALRSFRRRTDGLGFFEERLV